MATPWCCFLQQHDWTCNTLFGLRSVNSPTLPSYHCSEIRFWCHSFMSRWFPLIKLFKIFLKHFLVQLHTLQSSAPHRNMLWNTQASGKLMHKGRVKPRFSMCLHCKQAEPCGGKNECHLLRLINKEHADVQLGRICFGSLLCYMLSVLN